MPGLAGTASAFESGWQDEGAALKERRARKEALEDEQRGIRVKDLLTQRDNIVKTLPNLTGDDLQKARDALDTIHGSLTQVYHPDHGADPYALHRDWHWLSGLIRKARPMPAAPASAVTPGATFTPDAQTVTLPKTPGYDAASPSPWSTPDSWLTPDASRTAASLSAVPKITKQPGTPASLPITLPSAPVAIPGTTTPQVRSLAQMTPQQRQAVARRAQAQAETALDVAGAGLSPTQEAAADSTKKLVFLRQGQKDFDTLNPNATTAQKAQFFSDLVEREYGIAQRPVWKEFIGPNGEKQWLDASRPELIPPGWNATGAETADTRLRSDFEEYKRKNPTYTGTLQQWKVEQGQLGKLAVPSNRDDRYIAIQQKKAEGTPLTKDEAAYEAAWDLYINKRVLDPIRTRAAANADDRYVQVMDPTNPEKVTFMRAGEAARSGAGSPASIGFQTDKALNKYMIAGRGGENIAAFNTATNHLKILGEVGDALQNGDIVAVNRLGNIWASETGEEGPTDFNAVKNAVAGEISKVFTGRGATQEEIAQINATINNAQSPEQIRGAIRYYTDLMDGKLGALKSQWTMGMGGQPAFPTATPAAGGAGGGAKPKTVKMKAPPPNDKIIKDVPLDQVEHYKSLGAVEVK
jgi:hypothetical protein